MELNNHNKKEYPPMHSAEHNLNQTMVRLFGCARSKSSHIEKKKSKCDYFIPDNPTPEKLAEIEDMVNEQISKNLEVTESFINIDEVPAIVDLSKLPDNVSNTLRLVSIGDYDICACIGEHVINTSEIGKFKIISSDYNEGKIMIRFKLEDTTY